MRRRRVTGRKVLSLVLGVVFLVVAHRQGWIAAESVVVLLAAVLGTTLVCEVAAVTFPAGGSTRTVHARVAAQLLAVTVPIYLTGWGPVLMTGYLYLIV